MGQRATFKGMIEHQDESGAVVYKQLPPIALILDGYNRYAVQRRQVAAAEAGLALDVTGAVALAIVSHDEPFGFKLAAADAATLANCREVKIVGDDVATGTLGTGVAPVLIGNGTTPASVEIWTFYK